MVRLFLKKKSNKRLVKVYGIFFHYSLKRKVRHKFLGLKLGFKFNFIFRKFIGLNFNILGVLLNRGIFLNKNVLNLIYYGNYLISFNKKYLNKFQINFDLKNNLKNLYFFKR